MAAVARGRSITQFMSTELIQGLARPSNFRYGHAIHRRGGVELITSNQTEVEAWVGGLDGTVAEGGGQRRRTRLSLSRGRLRWHCAGNPANHQVFCKHCVALGLSVIARR